MTLEDARQIALERVRQKEAVVGRPLSLVEASIREIEAGFVFFWNATRFLKTGNDYDALIGQGPLIVLRNGEVLEGGSRDTPESLLNFHGLLGRPHYSANVDWAPWKGTKHTPGGVEYRASAAIAGREGRIPVSMTRTSEKGIWDIAFSVDPPHGDITFDVEVQLFEGSREAGRAVLKGWIPPDR